MDVSWNCCGDHFTIYVNQTIVPYTLNLYSDVCQFFIKKTEKKKRNLWWLDKGENKGEYDSDLQIFKSWQKSK